MKTEELFIRARNALAARDFPLAERFAKQLEAANKDEPAVYVLLGNVYAKTDAGNNAIRAFQRAIELDPRNAEAHNNIGVVYKRIGNLPAAVRAFETAYELVPNRPDVAYNLGNVYKQVGDRSRAEEFYRRAIQSDPSYALAYNNLGSMYEDSGNHDEAAKIYRQGLEKDPNNPTLRYNLGVALETRGAPEEALPEFQHALRARPGWVEGLNNLGVVFEKLDKTDRAVRIYDEILKQNPSNAKVRNNLGHALARQGRREDAESHFIRALGEDPTYARAALNLSQVREEGGNLEGALDALTALESRAENLDAEIPLRKASVLTSLGKLREADSELKKALAREPRNPRAHVVRGNLLRKSGKRDAALAAFSRAVELDPSLTEARMNGAIVLREAGRLAEATTEAKRIVEAEPSSFEPRLLLAQLHADQGELESAAAMLEQLRSERPKDDVVARDLIEVYTRAGMPDQAMRAANDLLNLHGHVDSAFEIDRLSDSLELHEQAAQDLAAKNEELISRSIRALSEEVWQDEFEGVEGESVLFGELPNIAEEEAAIIDVGGIEPIIAVNEEEERINLREMEEEWEPIPETPKKPEGEPSPGSPTFGPPAGTAPGEGAAPGGTDRSGAGERSGPGEGAAPGGPDRSGAGERSGGADSRGEGRRGGAAPPGAAGARAAEDTGGAKRGANREEEDAQAGPAGAKGSAGRSGPLSFTGSLRIELVQQPPSPPESKGETRVPEDERKSREPRPAGGHSPTRAEGTPSGPAPLRQEVAMPTSTPVPAQPAQEAGDAASKGRMDGSADLFAYLDHLTRYLPREQRSIFEGSDMHLRIETIERRLRGDPGLKQVAELRAGLPASKRVSPAGIAPPSPSITPDRLEKTFDFIDRLSESHPDREVRLALKYKIAHILQKLRGQ